MLKHATKFSPYEQHFCTAEQAGFCFAEFWLDAKFLANWQTVVETASEFPMQYALQFPHRGEISEQDLVNAISLYHALDCQAMVIHQPTMRQVGKRLEELDSTVRVGVENHVLRESELQQWCEESEWLTLDVEHLWMHTYPYATLDKFLGHLRHLVSRMADKLIHVHLPGYWPGLAEHRPMYCSREMTLAVLSILADNKFDGLIVSEVGLEFQNLAELRMDVLLVERWQELRADVAKKNAA